uniref:Plastid movement impaired 2 n=1 Tax=Glycine max TaxID=3847 RepID=A0A0R0ID33_SOYBN
MGNALGGKKTTKLKTPIKVCDVLKDHPGLVLLESEAVKHYGIRAKPLEAHKELMPKRLYFLVELPKEVTVAPRRVRSGINMSAKERLESLVLARRSASDLTIMKPPSSQKEVMESGGGVRLKMRLPKAEVERLMRGCETEAEAAEKIMGLCMANNGGGVEARNGDGEVKGRVGESTKAREKRVSFMPINEGGSPIAVAS